MIHRMWRNYTQYDSFLQFPCYHQIIKEQFNEDMQQLLHIFDEDM